tara:strand:- start:441 stop:704 length:264 start_codon:yes stop_codon:yes gene_type:complete
MLLFEHTTLFCVNHVDMSISGESSNFLARIGIIYRQTEGDLVLYIIGILFLEYRAEPSAPFSEWRQSLYIEMSTFSQLGGSVLDDFL